MSHRPHPKLDEVKYIHLRNFVDEWVQVSNRGGLTIAYRYVDANHVNMAIARCNVRDNFCRRIGRAIALGRLEMGWCWELKVPEKGAWDEIVNYALHKIRSAAADVPNVATPVLN